MAVLKMSHAKSGDKAYDRVVRVCPITDNVFNGGLSFDSMAEEA